jgi:two-component sensor histidine kinase
MERSSIRVMDGEERIIDWSIVRNLDASGMLSGATGIGHDTTEMVRARESVEKSLNEKDILLREVHHRVKNNLQVITSLLSLQQTGTEDQVVLGALVDASSRIQSIALVHELLYDSDDFGDLDFRKYAESLTSHLLARQLDPPLRYLFNFDQLKLRLTEAVPCGLILNEAITNSIKHAFPCPVTDPCVEITGAVQADGLTRIEIRDNGKGIDGQAAAETGTHLGLTIMRGLAEQVHGSIRFHNDGGAVVELVFKSSAGTLQQCLRTHKSTKRPYPTQLRQPTGNCAGIAAGPRRCACAPPIPRCPHAAAWCS